MRTFQDFQTAVEKGKQMTFIRDAIEEHRHSDAYEIAVMADEYDAQQNRTINEAVRRIYSLAGAAVEDFTASNNRIASNFFKRLVTHVRGSSVRIQSKKPSILNVDGECFPINDITLHILPKALRFIVPTEYITAKNKARYSQAET